MQFAEPSWYADLIGGEQVEDEKYVTHVPSLVGAGISPRVHALVSLKMELLPSAELQPGVNPEQEKAGK